MTVTTSGARFGAAAAIAFALSLAASGAAHADGRDGSRDSSSSAESGRSNANPAHPTRAPRQYGRRPAAGAVAPSAAAIATAPAVGPTAVLATDEPATYGGGPFPTSNGIPAAPRSTRTVPTASATPTLAPTADLAVSDLAPSIGRLIDAVGSRVDSLPAGPVTELLSGALLLARRDIAQPGAGTPTCGSTCTGQLLAGAATAGHVLTVTNRVDGAPGSLRDVLSRASSGDVIRFAPRLWHANLELTHGELDVDVSVRIEGTQQTLDAKGLSRVMRLDQPGTSIALSGLTFRNGAAAGDPYLATAGGAILADGVTLDISRSCFTGNSAVATQAAQPSSSFKQAGLGGAIAAFNSTLSITDSEFSRNTASGADNDLDQQASAGLGGAVFASDSTLVLSRSRFVGNAAVGGSAVTPIGSFPTSDGGWGAGGAIFSQGGPLSATQVRFDRNSATGGDGLDGSETNPFGNEVGAGGRASAGALWIQGRGRGVGDPVAVVLNDVEFSRNTATAGDAGAQGSATLAGKQGGRAVGGAFGTVEWVNLDMTDVTFAHNIAQGGGVGPNAPGAGPNTGTGGVAQGGAAYVESPASVQATRLSVICNTSQGGTGGDSAPGSGTEAGEGGFAYGGGFLMYNATGTGIEPGEVIRVGMRDTSFVGNRALGGQPGEGPQPELGGGGLAQGGGMSMIAVFEGDLVGVRFLGNSAIAGPGKPAYGGGLINPFAEPRPGQEARLSIQNSLFRNNTAVGGADAANVDYRQTAGGGFYNNGAGTVISGTRFVGNSAIGGNDTGSGHVGSALGGAIYSLGRDPSFSTVNTSFLGNSAVGGRRTVPGESTPEISSGEALGGAVHAANGTTVINGGVLLGNRAMVRANGDRTAGGGAIDIAEPPDGYVNLLTTTGVQFTANVADSASGTSAGGAVAFSGTRFTDNGSTFRYNVARSGWARGSAFGGALLIEQASRLTGTTVTQNRAVAALGYGGGVALPHGPGVLTEVQTTVRHNAATTAGNNIWSPNV